MNSKLTLVIGLAVVIAIGWILFQGDTIDYVSTIDDEVAALEGELADIEAAVVAGNMTPEEAAKAQTRIANRLEAINSAVELSERASLSPAQRAQLLDGLDRLKTILITYQSTLGTVDDAVMKLPESERPHLNPRGRGGGGNRTTVDAIRDIIMVIEDHAEDVIEDYTPEESADDEMDESAPDADTVDEEMGTSSEADNSSTTTEADTTEDTASTTSETEDGTGTSTEEKPMSQ